ncbi:MAG: c-type cytochrome domain-containing protein [Bacteroidota bacterium]
MRRLLPSAQHPRIISAAAGCVLAAAVLLMGCEDETSGQILSPESNISYGQHIQPIFNQSCAISGCHNSSTRQSDLSLESYVETTARPGIIEPGDPDASVLVQRIEGSIQPQMPFNRAPLPSDQINVIRQWILEGAKNN